MGVHKTNPGLNVHSNTGAILEGEMVSAEKKRENCNFWKSGGGTWIRDLLSYGNAL